MATPAYSTDLVSINADAESTTGWSALGGGGAGLSADPDFAIEPTNSITKQVSATSGTVIKGMVYEYGSTRTQNSTDHIYQWIYATTPGLMDVLSGGGMRVSVGTSDSDLMEYYIRGSDTYAEGGWVCEPVRYDSAVTPSPGRKLGTPGSAPSSFGGQLAITASIKAVNFGLDVCYEGNNISVTAGDSGDPATYEKLTDYSYDDTRRWAVILPIAGGAKVQGRVNWGGGSSCYARDQGKLVLFVDTPHSLSNLSQIIHADASSDQEFLGFTFLALGTNNRGLFVSQSSDPAVDYTGSTFIGIDTWDLYGATILADCTFVGTNEVTPAAAADLTGCLYDAPTVATDSAAVVWNIATNPSTYLDNSSFIMGSNNHHAIEFGTSAPTTITLTGMTYSGFSGTGTAATLNFLRTSGTTTVNYTGTLPTAQVTGSHTVTFVQSNDLTVNVDQDTNTEVRVYDAGTTTAVGGIETIGGTLTYTLAIDAATYPDVDVAIISLDYINERRAAVDMSAGDVVIDIQQRTARQYDDP